MTTTLKTLDTSENMSSESTSSKPTTVSSMTAAPPGQRPNVSEQRLAVLTHYLPPYTSRVLQHITEAFPRTHVLLSIPVEPNRRYALDWGNLNVEVQKSVMLRRPWKHRAGFKDELYVHLPYDTYAKLRRLKPDLVFSYELGFRSLASAMYRRLHSRSRLALCVCVSEHTEAGRGSSRWLLRKTLVNMADAITYNGPSCLRYLRQLSIPEHKLFSYPYAPDDRTEPPSRSHALEPNRRLLVVGQLSERKGVLKVVESLSSYCSRYPDQSWDLTFIGSGPLEQTLKHWNSPANLQLTLLDHMAPEELASNWHRYGVLLFPTLADEWGLVVNEAMRAGLPVLGSRYAQACEALIVEGSNGWLYSPDKPDELHSKLQRLAALTADELHVMRHSARASVAHITSRAVANLACQMLHSLCP
jgi:glycosyltransferase involved in cell wall biosynthesis